MNVSEGQRGEILERLAAAAAPDLLDLHADPDHNRAVLTMVGETAPRAVATEAVALLDIHAHMGVHPRRGVVDVVPFVPLGSTPLDDAIGARDRFATWASGDLRLPCFLYGPERTLPDVRKRAFVDLQPDIGPDLPHPTAGACCVGARPPLVAYNLWLGDVPAVTAKAIAGSLRGPAVRALAFAVTGGAQVSCNLLDPLVVGPSDVYDAVDAQSPVRRAELVGLVPQALLDATPENRWSQLDLDPDRTIEARLRRRG